MRYAPKVLGRNSAKLNAYFRIQQDKPKSVIVDNQRVENKERYPIGRYPYKVDVSFGSRKPSRPNAAIRLNEPQAILNSQNKLRAKEIWSQLDGIPFKKGHKVSKFMTPRGFDLTLFEEQVGYPCVMKRIASSGGRGFRYIPDADTMIAVLGEFSRFTMANKYERHFFEEYFEMTHEYRVHVSAYLPNSLYFSYNKYDDEGVAEHSGPIKFEPQVFCQVRKVIRQEAFDAGRRHRSMEDGGAVFFKYGFTQPQQWPQICEVANDAIAALGLDFGFIDVMYNRHSGEFCFAESGCNPGMTIPEVGKSITAQLYQQALPHIILNKHMVMEPRRSVLHTPTVQSICVG